MSASELRNASGCIGVLGGDGSIVSAGIVETQTRVIRKKNQDKVNALISAQYR